ncbi:MAG: hypothetical protein KatS3mg018_0619 [Fimbriimonadales bacterium]|nr:MAG: hypothetical protein KatS3mg018_0619 [Fimbriimonadales bacterium]
MRYTGSVAVKRIRLWALLFIALLNSGGMGYWVCHEQVRSGCFWLRACSDDVSLVLQATQPPLPSSTPALQARPCDCEFVALTAPVPAPSQADAPLVWADAPLLHTLHELSVAYERLPIPANHSPPPSSSSIRSHHLRAPPVA